MFGLFGKKKAEKQVEAAVNSFSEQCDTDFDFDDIWEIENQTDFLIAMDGWLCKKGNYGEAIEKLSHAERVFYCIFQLEGEVNNGGFSQYLFNSSGNFANEIVDALNEIGAVKMAGICEKALAALGCNIPADRYERQEKLEDVETDEVDEELNECDNEFYEYPDDLTELNYQYIIKNRAQFTRE